MLYYLASKYTEKTKMLEALNYQRTMEITRHLMVDKGLYVISPIVHCHALIEGTETPGNWEYWKYYNKRLIKVCDAMIVYWHIEQTENSVGVVEEMKYATTLHKPIYLITQFRDGTYEIPEEIQ
jgi:hypothetical protein